jgi:hypothetical protein
MEMSVSAILFTLVSAVLRLHSFMIRNPPKVEPLFPYIIPSFQIPFAYSRCFVFFFPPCICCSPVNFPKQTNLLNKPITNIFFVAEIFYNFCYLLFESLLALFLQ